MQEFNFHACRMVLLAAFAAGLYLAPAAAQAPTSVPSSVPTEAATRSLWRPGEARFLRHWLFLGPVTGDLTGLLGVVPTAGLKHILADGRTLVWQSEASWTDLVDVSSLLNTAVYRGSHASSEIAYAYTTIERDNAGEGVLSLASDGPLRVWLNGKLIGTVTAPRTFLFDQDRMPVHFVKGENRLLIELEHRSGPWRFAARVLAAGQVVASVNEITPTLVDRNGVVDIRTDIAPDSSGAPVHVAAVAPGGDILEQADAARGATVHFATASWHDGPYEFRLSTKAAEGSEAVVHLPWYKGDARVAVQKLLDAAKAPPLGPSTATLRMLADLVRGRLGDNPASAPDDAWPLVQSALMEYAELQQEAVGKPRSYGFVRLAYTDDVDGSTQFCRAYLPPHYNTSRHWPVIISLHGFNPENPPYVRWWDIDKRHDAIADQYDVIVLEPHGRGNAQYVGIGEQDVLRCLSAAKQRFSVDDDRVYLTGESMGGSGTWLIASHHPELFAAAAPVFGGFDYRLIHGAGFDNPKADQLPERFAAEYQSSFREAEGLSNLPLFVTHGDNDQAVPVDFSRFAATMLQQWNYNIRYEEIAGRGHEDLDLGDRIVTWLLAQRRVHDPREVRIRAFDLDNASAYWAHILAFEEPLQAMDVNAEVLRPGLIRLDTKNVAAIGLTLPAELRGTSTLEIVWNGRRFKASPDATGAVLLKEPGAKIYPSDKRPGLEGGLSNVITTPFAVVMGTSSPDPRMRAYCREKAESFVTEWMNWQHVKPRLLLDSEVTAADEQRYSLLLVGGADANLVSRRLMPRLPLRIDANSVTIDGKRFAAHDAVVQMVYPSPVSSAHSVMVVAATSADGMYLWNTSGLWNTPFGFPTQPLDWTIRDGRLVALANGLGIQRSAIASGVFDTHWQNRYVFMGDAALRGASPLRRPPPPGLTPTAALIAAFSGQYELPSGVKVTVAKEANGLVIDLGGGLVLAGEPQNAGGLKYALNEESDDLFVLGDTGTVVVFSRDAQGRTTGLTINRDGGQTPARKIN